MVRLIFYYFNLLSNYVSTFAKYKMNSVDLTTPVSPFSKAYLIYDLVVYNKNLGWSYFSTHIALLTGTYSESEKTLVSILVYTIIVFLPKIATKLPDQIDYFTFNNSFVVDAIIVFAKGS